MARKQKERERDRVRTISQSSWVFPVTPDLCLLLNALASISNWSHGPWYKFFCTRVFGCHLEPNFHGAVFLLWTFGCVVSVWHVTWWCESWKAVWLLSTTMVLVIEEASCPDVDNPTQRVTGLWTVTKLLSLSGGRSLIQPMLSEGNHLIWYFCYNFIRLLSSRKKLKHCKIWTLTNCKILKCSCKLAKNFCGKSSLLCTIPKGWYFLNLRANL